MKKGIIVCGAQSSGNHLVSSILMNSGFCGDLTGKQDDKLDAWLSSGKEKVVWRGSVPYGNFVENKWYNLSERINLFTRYGYDVKILVVIREWCSTICSQVAKYTAIEDKTQALSEIRKAYTHIFEYLIKEKIGYFIVNYESLVYQKKATIAALSLFLEVELKSDLEIYNGNSKWYEELI